MALTALPDSAPNVGVLISKFMAAAAVGTLQFGLRGMLLSPVGALPQVEAGNATTLAGAGIDVQVVPNHLVAFGTMGRAILDDRVRLEVSGVLLGGKGLEVLPVNAGSAKTAGRSLDPMVEIIPWGNSPNKHLIAEPVGQVGTAIAGSATVPIRVNVPPPKPTTGLSVEADMVEETSDLEVSEVPSN